MLTTLQKQYLCKNHAQNNQMSPNILITLTFNHEINFPNYTVHIGKCTHYVCRNPGGGHSTFFQVGVCGPDFRSVGLATWHMPLKRGGLWAENFQIWGLVSWKFPNLGACELKISKFGGLWARIWVKIEAVQAKISKFSQKGVLWTDSFAWNGTLASGRRGEKKGVFRAAHPHTHFLGQCPLPPPPGPGIFNPIHLTCCEVKCKVPTTLQKQYNGETVKPINIFTRF